jgi:hypothetical protein
MRLKKLAFERRRVEGTSHWPAGARQATLSEIVSLEQRMHRERINNV